MAAETKKISKKRVTAAGGGGEAGLARFKGGLGGGQNITNPLQISSTQNRRRIRGHTLLT